MAVSVNSCINHKGGETMEVLEEMNNGEIIQIGLEDFKNIQDYMIQPWCKHVRDRQNQRIMFKTT